MTLTSPISGESMFRGFATTTFSADDVSAASRWYAELLGVEPYYAMPPLPATPAYIEFRIGDDADELGIIDRRYAPSGSSGIPGGAVVYWHVDDLAETVRTVLAMGAVEHEPITDRGEGFATASVVDPFGNILGVMTNPHFLEMLARSGRAG